jgi:hypothetical protein
MRNLELNKLKFIKLILIEVTKLIRSHSYLDLVILLDLTCLSGYSLLSNILNYTHLKRNASHSQTHSSYLYLRTLNFQIQLLLIA